MKGHFNYPVQQIIIVFFFSAHPQVSVLTDQVEAQGLKINDLESSLVEHQHKLNCTEEMLQQVHSFADLTGNVFLTVLCVTGSKSGNADFHKETFRTFMSILFF